MQIVPVPPHTLHHSAFCLSSVGLWVDPARDTVCEVAATVSEDGSALGEVLAIGRTRAGKVSAWIPHLDVRSNRPEVLTDLLDWVSSQLRTESRHTTVFAETGSNAAEALARSGWRAERGFPVQFVWDEATMASAEGPTPDSVVIDTAPSIEEVARLFADAFKDQWDWYFAEMGYRAGHDTPERLTEVSLRFVANADGYFVARVDGKPAGLSTVKLDTGQRRAEFHTGVGVMPTARAAGLGRLLTRFTLQWSYRHGMTSAEIRTQERLGVENRNVKMYLACGAVRQRAFTLFRPQS